MCSERQGTERSRRRIATARIGGRESEGFQARHVDRGACGNATRDPLGGEHAVQRGEREQVEQHECDEEFDQ